MVIELSGVKFGLISTSNERAARVRFEITNMVSDQIARLEVQSPPYKIHFETTGYPYNVIGSQRCDLFTYLFLSQ